MRARQCFRHLPPTLRAKAELPAGQELPKGANACGAKTKQGTVCRKAAGAETDHLGYGRCKFHGGAGPTGRIAAARMEALDHAVVMGQPIDLAPHDALLWCVRIAAGEVQYATQQVQALDRHAVTGPPITLTESGKDTERKEHPIALHIWVRTRQEALDRLARFSKMALDAGVAERQVQIAEQFGMVIANVLQNVLADLDLDVRQQRLVPTAVEHHLAAIESSSVVAA